MQSQLAPRTGEPASAMWQSAHPTPIECGPFVIGNFASGWIPADTVVQLDVM
jgi:hypothetical protein